MLEEPERPRPREALRPREGDLFRETLVSRDRDRDLSLPPFFPFFPFEFLDFALPFLHFPLLPLDPLEAERPALFFLRNPAHRVSCVMIRCILLRFHQRGHVWCDCVSDDASNRKSSFVIQGFLAVRVEIAYTGS